MPYPVIFDNPVHQAIYEAGQARVDSMKAELRFDDDGCLSLPFRCYGCDEQRSDLALMTGEGLPLCCRCFDGCVDAIAPQEAT